VLGASYASSGDPRFHFGVPGSAAPVDVRVIWPGGQVSDRRAIAPAQILRVERDPR
jgi:hypothetical protein